MHNYLNLVNCSNLATEQLVEWAVETFPENIVMSSSFGKYSAATIHLVTRFLPKIPVIFVQHPFLPQTTVEFVKQLQQVYKLDLHIIKPKLEDRFSYVHDVFMNEDPQLENERQRLRNHYKKQPFDLALKEIGASAWLSGIMKYETTHREHLLSVTQKNDIVCVYPLLNWEHDQLLDYIQQNRLPVNRGHFDIFKGPNQKVECGIHTNGKE